MNNQVTTRVIFDRKNSATNLKAALVQIEVRYNGKRALYSTGVKVFKNQWKNSRVCNCMLANEYNDSINILYARIQTIINQLAADNIAFSFDALNSVLCKNNDTYTFVDFMRERIEARPLKESTKKQHRKVLHFLEREYTSICTFKDLTLKNITLLDNYLHNRVLDDGRKMLQTSIHVYHKVLKAYINDAITLEYIKENPYQLFRSDAGTARPRTVLDMHDIELLRSYTSRDMLMNKVRDLFVVQIYTGLSYIDLMQADFTRAEKINGEMILRDSREKTNTQYLCVLLPPVIEILERYNYNLPKMSYDVYNRWLKAVAAAAGITKHVSTHIGRHTFATTICLSNGVPIEMVARLLGHNDVRTTQIYAKIMPDNVANTFAKLAIR